MTEISFLVALSSPGFWEILFLLMLGLLIFGPERLPKMARSAGEMIAKFKAEAAGTLDELKAAADLEELSDVARDLRDTTSDLKRSVDLTGPLASAAGASKSRTATPSVSADIAAPFDPDAP